MKTTATAERTGRRYRFNSHRQIGGPVGGGVGRWRPRPALPRGAKIVTFPGALLVTTLLSLMLGPGSVTMAATVSTLEPKPTVDIDERNMSTIDSIPPEPVAPAVAAGGGPQLTEEAAIILPAPEALSLTTQLADDSTASALQPLAGSRNDPTSVPSAAALPTMEAAAADGRRRRRLGRKRKRRPLQEDYWSLGDGKPAEEFEPIAGPSDPSPPSGGRMSDRKRLPYAGAAASRWEGIGPQRKPSEGKLGARPSDNQPPAHHHHRLLGRPNDWLDNPYTDAGGGTAAMYQRRAVPPTATSGNFAPIDSNRARKVPAVRHPEQQPSASSPGAATGGGHKAYRKPYSRRNEETSGESSNEAIGLRLSPAPTTAADLKALLKQSDGSLSLSEILQQRNISLQDLIKGKQMALAALTQSPLDVTTTTVRLADDDTTTVSPTLASVRFRVSEEFVTGRPPVAPAVTVTVADTAEHDENHLPSGPETPPTRGKHPQAVPQPEDDTNNSVDDVAPSRVASDDDTGVAIFPTVEIKQLALNPVLPVVKDAPEQRMRPIKGVASRIRPDLSNTHIRTDPVSPGRFPDTVTTPPSATAATNGSPTISSFLLATSTARERWTPSASLVERHREQLQQKQQSLVTASTEQAPMADELVARPRSAESSSALPEAEAMVGPERHHLLRVPKLKPRIAIKPRLPNAVAATAAGVEQPSTASPVVPVKVTEEEPDRFNLSDVELTDDSGAQELTPGGGGSDGVRPSSSSSSGSKNSSTSTSQSRRQQRLNDDEPELNIIEKFTSFADPPSAPSSASSPVGQDDEDAEQAVAELIGRISEHTQRSFTDSLEDFYRDVTESNPSLFNDLSPVASSDDRRELLELMEDRRIGSRLAKVLSQRNMTLEQLLEHRRRGSSQLHLAEIANGKVKPIDDKIDIVTAFEHFPRFNIGNLRSIRPDDIKLDSQGFSYFTSIINIRPSADDGYKEARALHAGRQWSRRHPAAVAEGPSAYPANHRSSDGHFLAKGGSKDRLLVPSRISAATGPYERPGERSEEQAVAGDSDLLDLELSGHGFQHQHHPGGGGSVMIESTSMPAGVRSAIVASSAIVGLSLAIFISIYVVCRLRQRRRGKLNYTENFNMAKGRLPIIHSATADGRKSSASGRSNVSSLGTEQQVVYTTHRALMTAGQSDSGRPTDTMDSNNSLDVQDYLWDRKPFQ